MVNLIKKSLMALGAMFVLVIAAGILAAIASFGDKVAVVELEGVITDPIKVTKELEEYGNRSDVKAVVLRINSPGGAVGPSQEIYSAVKKLKAKKKVVASMGTLAASGGYYIAIAADEIVANPGTITGSIGVIIEFVNFEELFKKVGLKGYVVKSGKFKDTGSPLREMTPEEAALLSEAVMDVHRQFVEAVSESRKIKKEKIDEIADGRVFTGAQAKALGLVDKLGSLSDSIDEARRLAGIDEKAKVIYPKKYTGLAGILFGDSAEEASRILKDIPFSARLMYRMPQFSR